MLAIECDPTRIAKRLETRYLDEQADSLEDALQRLNRAKLEGRAVSIGLLGNAAELLPRILPREFVRMRSPIKRRLMIHWNGYLPAGWTWNKR